MGFLGGTTDYRAQQTPIRKVDYAGALEPMIYGYNPEQMNQSRDQQVALSNQLMEQAQGKGPNLAEMQFAQALAKGQEQGASAISSQKGINPALAARLIGQQGAGYNQAAAMGAGQLRAQQQLSAQEQLARALEAQRGQDIQRQNLDTQRLATIGQLQQGQNQLDVQQGLGVQDINSKIEMANALAHQKYIGAGIKAWGDSSAQFMGSMGSFMGGGADGGYPEDFTMGGEVPGEAPVSGDSEKNDIVHAMLSPDEIVLPRTVAMDESGESAKEFVQELAKSSKKKSESSYADVVKAKKNCGGKV